MRLAIITNMATPRIKCNHTHENGQPCKAWATHDAPTCYAHSGRLATHARDGALARAKKVRDTRKEAEIRVEMAKLGFDEVLAVEAAKVKHELARKLLDLALKQDDRQAILAVYDRLEGRATQRVLTEQAETGSDMGQLGTEELRRMLRVIPGGNPTPRIDTGIEATQ